MDDNRDMDLLKRVARLIKQNKELHQQVRQLSEINNRLAGQVEFYRQKLPENKASGTGKQEDENTIKSRLGTVLYAGFHRSGNMPDPASRKMMDELDNLVILFDSIVERHGLKKIRSIGDSFMCAGGIPGNSTNPVDVVLAALEMLGGLDKASKGNGPVWEIRIGIHTGPVTAVMNEKKKLINNLKGDTVNIACRLSASCQGNRLNISANTYELVKEFFACDYNGRIPVRYLGNLSMYYVQGVLPEISLNREGLVPDENFDTRLKLLRFVDLQEVILDRLEKELPDYLSYHNVKHTIDVVTEVELIGWAEGATEHDILLLKTAALFHDSGHIRGYDNHEELGCELAREYLPGYDYSRGQIEQVCRLIMATKMPPVPKDLLEKIMCDSDLDYLGRSDFIPVSNSLYEELRKQDKIGSLEEWNKIQIAFISNHQYYTETARNLREVNKQRQIERIKSLAGE